MATNTRIDGGDDIRSKHSSLWLSDGNIVLAASPSSDQQRTILFRIHKSILSRHSQVFSDMFALPAAPADNEDVLEGLPLIRMHDSGEDLEALLKYLYGPTLVRSLTSCFILADDSIDKTSLSHVVDTQTSH